jgi:hypothetical protein
LATAENAESPGRGEGRRDKLAPPTRASLKRFVQTFRIRSRRLRQHLEHLFTILDLPRLARTVDHFDISHPRRLVERVKDRLPRHNTSHVHNAFSVVPKELHHFMRGSMRAVCLDNLHARFAFR